MYLPRKRRIETNEVVYGRGKGGYGSYETWRRGCGEQAAMEEDNPQWRPLNKGKAEEEEEELYYFSSHLIVKGDTD